MKKYKEKKIKLGKCTCKFLNNDNKQVYIKNYSGYLFRRSKDSIYMSFFLDKKDIIKLKKIVFNSIKVEFNYNSIMLEIKQMSRIIERLLKVLYFILHKIFFFVKKEKRLNVIRVISNFNKKIIKAINKFWIIVLNITMFKVISNKNNECSFEIGYSIPKIKEEYTRSINFKYDFNDIYYLNVIKNEKGKNEIKLPNILTKKTNEQI